MDRRGTLETVSADVVARLRARLPEIERAIFATLRAGPSDPAGWADTEYVRGLRMTIVAVLDLPSRVGRGAAPARTWRLRRRRAHAMSGSRAGRVTCDGTIWRIQDGEVHHIGAPSFSQNPSPTGRIIVQISAFWRAAMLRGHIAGCRDADSRRHVALLRGLPRQGLPRRSGRLQRRCGGAP